jgi:hypothetical protein
VPTRTILALHRRSMTEAPAIAALLAALAAQKSAEASA